MVRSCLAFAFVPVTTSLALSVLPRHTDAGLGSAEKCWEACGQKGGMCDWCGPGRACCRRGFDNDPIECRRVRSFIGDTHECVTPVNDSDTLQQGDECWAACGKGGYCDSCGKLGACCRKSWPDDPPECARVVNFTTTVHECVVPASENMTIAVGTDCWNACGGPGMCSACGDGKACCRRNWDSDPAICKRVVNFESDGIHECVTPLYENLSLALGDDCWSACGKSGLCSACGENRACCRRQWDSDSPECRRASGFTSQHHECVQLETILTFLMRYAAYSAVAIAVFLLIYKMQTMQEESLIGKHRNSVH
eukprot:TRINITY_DN75134_c0_g1_i1.p1 TRINITY_DN75134_c0_g1~~TRINITY_DN75134_c0_g1_i1.p1  ORF type:complete len:310 (+),score=24.74 TRINITY_DN75134_c0_g1_i1:121-1050(+)